MIFTKHQRCDFANSIVPDIQLPVLPTNKTSPCSAGNTHCVLPIQQEPSASQNKSRQVGNPLTTRDQNSKMCDKRADFANNNLKLPGTRF